MNIFSTLKNKIKKNAFIPTLPWGLISPFFITRKILANSISRESASIYGSVLDYGCGSKPYKSLFNYREYVGVDIDNPGHSHESENVDIFYDGLNLPFANNTFDSCFSSEVFEHIFDIDTALKEIKRVLKTNGKLLITTPFVWDEHEVPHDYCRYTSFGLKNVLERNGFTVLTYQKSGSFLELIAQMILVYLNRKMGSHKIFKFPFLLFMCPVINILTLINFKFKIPDQSIYLSHVVLAQKNKG